MWFIIMIAVAAYGLQLNMKWDKALSKENSMVPTFLAGVCGYIAFVAVGLIASGMDLLPLAVAGILGTVLFTLKPIRKGLEYQAAFKDIKDFSAMDKFKYGPVAAWLKFTVLGMGKCLKMLLFVTIIGIGPYRMMERQLDSIENYAKQREYQETKEALEEYIETRRAIREGLAEARRDRRNEAENKARNEARNGARNETRNNVRNRRG